jgi:Ca2+/Na+ antiporter
MAVSNAMGSNTFNILIGLGLPWTLYVSTLPEGEEYHLLPAEGIVDSVVLLIATLAGCAARRSSWLFFRR